VYTVPCSLPALSAGKGEVEPAKASAFPCPPVTAEPSHKGGTTPQEQTWHVGGVQVLAREGAGGAGGALLRERAGSGVRVALLPRLGLAARPAVAPRGYGGTWGPASHSFELHRPSKVHPKPISFLIPTLTLNLQMPGVSAHKHCLELDPLQKL